VWRLIGGKKSCFGQSITNGRRVGASNAIALPSPLLGPARYQGNSAPV
jgi:hypothetical protein